MPKSTPVLLDQLLEPSLKDELCPGWSLQNRNCEALLSSRLKAFDQSDVHDIEWASADQAAILNTLSGIRTSLEEQLERTIKKARDGNPTSTARSLESEAKGGLGDWMTSPDGILNVQRNLRQNSKAGLKRIVNRVVEMMEHRRLKNG